MSNKMPCLFLLLGSDTADFVSTTFFFPHSFVLYALGRNNKLNEWLHQCINHLTTTTRQIIIAMPVRALGKILFLTYLRHISLNKILTFIRSSFNINKLWYNISDLLVNDFF